MKRLGWYLVGFSIGLVFLVFFVKKKAGESGIEFCYLPNCRVLKDIRSKPFLMEGSTADTIYFSDMDKEVKNILTDGDIDFEQSNTKSIPCKTYRINYEKMVLIVENCPEQATIKETLVSKD